MTFPLPCLVRVAISLGALFGLALHVAAAPKIDLGFNLPPPYPPAIVGGPAIAVAPGLTITDADHPNLTITITITVSPYYDGEDDFRLNNDQNAAADYNISISPGIERIDSARGDLQDPLFQAFVCSMTYQNTSLNPNTTPRTVTIQAYNGHGTASVTRVIDILPPNSPPVIIAGSGTTVYVALDAPVLIDNALILSDEDDSNFTSASVTVAHPITVDRLNFIHQGNITGTYNNTTFTLSLNGTDTVAAYQTALRTVTFDSTTSDPTINGTNVSRTLQFVVNDGTSDSGIASITLTVYAILLADVSVASTYVEADLAAVVSPGLTISNPPGGLISGAAVSVTANFQTTTDFLNFTNQNGITGNYSAATGVLALTGTASLLQYQTALRTVTFSSTSLNPTNFEVAPTRVIALTVSDSAITSTALSRTINVNGISTRPSTTSGGTFAYTESAVAGVIDANITVTDTDSNNISGASVTITTGFLLGDTLTFVPVGNITGSYNSTLGTLSLTGSDSKWNYQTALRSVTYLSTSLDPTDIIFGGGTNTSRTISWIVTSDGDDSLPTISTVNITAVDNAPTAIALSNTAILRVNRTNVDVGTLTSDDVDSLSFTYTLVSGTGSTDNSAFTISGATLIANYPATVGTYSILVRTTSGNLTFEKNFSISVTTNLPPIIVASATPVYLENADALAIDAALSLTDGDSSLMTGATVTISDWRSGDVLSFTPLGNVTGTYSAITGILSLTGVDTTATYQSALRSVRFNSTSNDPTNILTGGGLATTRSIAWSANDGSSNSSPVTSVITITPADDAPTAIALSHSSVAQSGGLLAPVGTLTTTDDDSIVFTYALISGSGSTDNSLFNISGASLRANDAASLAPGTYSVLIQTTAGLGTFSTPFTITATDDVAPISSGATTISTGYKTVFAGYTITASGTPTSFDATGLPPGLTVDTNSGLISGTPTTAAVYTVTLTATDASSNVGTGTLTLTVTKPTLTVTGITAFPKAYDGSTAATLVTTDAALVGIVPLDDVTLVTSAATGTFNDADPGSGKTVTVAGLTLTGTHSTNYLLTQPTTTATILAPVIPPVQKLPATVALSTLNSTYNGSAHSVSATVAPVGLSVDITYDGATGAPTDAGNYTVIATVNDANYAGTATGTLAIAKAVQTVSFPTIGGTGTTRTLSATASTGLPVTFSVVSGPGTISGSSLTITGTTAIVVRATQVGSGNYLAGTADQTISGAPQTNQTIAFGSLSDRNNDDSVTTLVASATSGLPVSFSVQSGPASLTGAVLRVTGPGQVSIRASQAGDATFAAAPDVVRTFVVTDAIANVFFGGAVNNLNVRVAEIAAVLPAASRTGRLLISSNSLNLHLIIEFVLAPDGSFVSNVTPTTGSIGNVVQGARHNDGRARAAALVTVVVRGSLVYGVLVGRVDDPALTFNVAVQPQTGPTAPIAGYYESTALNSNAGSSATIVGPQNQILVVVSTPGLVTGASGTVAANGDYSLAAVGATISGGVTATAITSTITEPNSAPASYSGLAGTVLRTDKIVNGSSRARITGTDRTLITGFVVGGTAPKRILLRAIGPTLTGFGVAGALANPRLQLFNSSGKMILENDDWSGTETSLAFTQLGAFALPAGSRDGAILATVDPGAYTMHVLAGTDSGVVLAEIYDATITPLATDPRLINVSSRGTVDAGDGALIGGFVVTGNSPRKVLIRGIGPTLAAFGVLGALPDPRLGLYSGSTLIAQNDDWSTPQPIGMSQRAATAAEIAAAAEATGAFVLSTNSKDAVLLLTLAPGAYTAQVSGASALAGVALVEIYEVP